MKVLIATGIFPPEIGGPATYAALLAEELKRRGDGVVILPFRDVRHLPRVVRHIVYFIKVVRYSAHVDIIFTQDPVSTGLPVIAAAFMNNKKIVMRVAGDYAWEQSVQRYGVTDSIDEFQTKKYSGPIEILRAVQRFAVRRADVVVTPSNYFRTLVSGWVGSRKVITIYNGIDLTVQYKQESKFSEKTIITAGRLVPWKGFDTLIRALKEMPEWRLLIAGDGPDRKRLEGIIAECGITNRVTFLGQLPRPELFAHIHRSHIFALLSTFESFSFQVVEAMRVGVPVIAARIGNLSEIIEDGKNGILIDSKDVESFTLACEKIVADASYADTLSHNAIARAQNFSITKTFDSLRAVFEKTINSQKP
jgi:glycosyltransferase involved in cell wall biosynthesis